MCQFEAEEIFVGRFEKPGTKLAVYLYRRAVNVIGEGITFIDHPLNVFADHHEQRAIPAFQQPFLFRTTNVLFRRSTNPL